MPAQDDPTKTATGSPSDPALEDTAAGDPSVTPDPSGRSLGRGSRIGRYEVLAVLGSGGMGVVYRARDPDLDRELAIKVVQPQAAGPRAQERLLEEARAMAKLRHPAVVPVFDVGVYAGQVYVVMPLLTGGTLHDWMHAAPRPWREVLSRFIAAGRGLAAAHAAGLIHRDFKPRNVLLGEAGEAIVADLGIAAHTTSREGTDGGEPAQVEVSSIAGTPAYMAPEQAAGATIDSRADQYSFCISLWEGLHGQRPDQAGTRTSRALTARVPAVPEARRGAPAWLLGAVARGFAPTAELRWPSMTALCDHLEHRVRRPRRVIIAAAAATVLGATAAAAFALAGGNPAVDPCPDPRTRVEAVWNPEVRTRIEAAFVSTKVAYATDALLRVTPLLDEAAAAWRRQHVEACSDNQASRNSDTLLDQRMACLDQRLGELESTTALLAKVRDRATLDRAVGAVRSMNPVASCDDRSETLLRSKPPPAEQKAEADAIRSGVKAVNDTRLSAGVKGLVPTIDALVVRARSLDHASTLALALDEQVSVLREMRDTARLRVAYEELAQAAARGGADITAAYAWCELMLLLGRELGLPDEGKKLLPVARAAVARAGDPANLSVLLRMNEAQLIAGHGEAPRALALLEEARAILRDKVDPAKPPANLADLQLAVTLAIAAAHNGAGNYEAALVAHREALALAITNHGLQHPRLAVIYANVGVTQRRAGRAALALPAYQEAARLVEQSAGASPMLIDMWERIADVLVEVDRQEESLAWFDKARALADKLLEPDDPQRILVIQSKGLALRELGRRDEALAVYDEVVAAWERAKTNPNHMRVALHNRGGTHRELGHWDLAVADYQRALALYEVGGKVDHRGINTLVGLGMAFLEAGRPAKAIAPLERAVAIAKPEKFAGMQLVGTWLLGRAKVESRQDVAGGHAAVQAARAELVAIGDAEEEIAKLDAWVAKARKR